MSRTKGAVNKSKAVEKYNHKIDIEEAFRLRFQKHLTLEEVGRVFGVTSSAVQQRLKKFEERLPNPEDVKVYRDNQSELLVSGMCKIFFELMRDGKIEEARYGELMSTFGMMFDKVRLLQDKSTANIAYKDVIKEREELQKALDDYEQRKAKGEIKNEA